MHPLFRKKFRVFTVVSVVFLAQACCCILPIRFQIEQQRPASQQTIQLEAVQPAVLKGIEPVAAFVNSR